MRDHKGRKVEVGDRVLILPLFQSGEVVRSGADDGIIVRIEMWIHPDDAEKVERQ